MGEDAGGGLGRDDAGVLVLVDDDAVEQGSVEHAAFSGFASVVEIAEVGKQVKELVETVPGAGIGGRHGVEASGDLVEAGADAFLLALEQVQRDRVGVVGLDELESFSFELVLLGFEELAFVVAGGFELVEHPAQHALYPFGPRPGTSPHEGRTAARAGTQHCSPALGQRRRRAGAGE
ncbi:hypothetical protein [Microbacterium binotii]|uniref:hypothetical protein n=1 Tax=Microbacterium binotii TaxID=462710 RepID=UPI0031D65471